MAVNAFVLGLTTIRYVAFHPCTVSSIHVCDFFPVYERCSRRGGTPPDRGVVRREGGHCAALSAGPLSLSLLRVAQEKRKGWTCAGQKRKKKKGKEGGGLFR